MKVLQVLVHYFRVSWRLVRFLLGELEGVGVLNHQLEMSSLLRVLQLLY